MVPAAPVTISDIRDASDEYIPANSAQSADFSEARGSFPCKKPYLLQIFSWRRPVNLVILWSKRRASVYEDLAIEDSSFSS